MFHVVDGSCRIIFGPMFSGKSTKLRQEITTLADIGLKTLYINHSIDNRKTEAYDQIITTHHSGFKGLSDKIDVIKIDVLSNIDVSMYDAIAIDEGQFFDDIDHIVREWVLKDAKIVIIASLDSDYMMRPFGKVINLICICESGNVEKLHAVCDKCLKTSLVNGRILRIPASFTAKFDINLRKSGYTQIEVGGNESYLPVCMKCYQEHMKKEIITISSIDVVMSQGI
jgi:thymidine kinase